METPLFRCSVGETLPIYLEAVSGDPVSASDVVARLKPMFSSMGPLPDEKVPSIASLVVTAQLTSPGDYPDGTVIGPGWYVTLTDEASATLDVGFYATDVAFKIGDQTFVTDPALIQIVNSVSLS
jgi:hypothetical protein